MDQCPLPPRRQGRATDLLRANHFSARWRNGCGPSRTSCSLISTPTFPFIFGGRANFREPLDKKLWGWVDRLIFDSSEWESPAEQFSLVQKIRTLTEVRTILCDSELDAPCWRAFRTRPALRSLLRARSHSQDQARLDFLRKAHHRSASSRLACRSTRWKLQPGNECFLSGTGERIDFEIQTTSRPCDRDVRVRLWGCDSRNLARCEFRILSGAHRLRRSLRCSDARSSRKK